MNAPNMLAPWYLPPSDPSFAYPWPRVIPFNNGAAAGVRDSGPGIIVGWSFAETSGTAVANLHLHDGTDASGPIIASISMLAGGGNTFGPGWPGIPVYNQLWSHNHAGTWEGAIYYVPLLGAAF